MPIPAVSMSAMTSPAIARKKRTKPSPPARQRTRPHVLILGGGFAGLSAAQALGADRHDVTLIDARLEATLTDAEGAYAGPDALLADLQRTRR